jgi:hypothetical protein
MARIIISAGHTNQDPGTTINGLREVDLTRAIVKKLIPYLRTNGLITLSIPPDMPLDKRISWINGTGYREDLNDIAIEIHVNDGGKSGFEFWYRGQNSQKSKQLADDVMGCVTDATGLPNQGVKSEFEHEFGSLAFISNTNTVSVLLECLYLDNPDDLAKLKDENELEKIAKGLAKGVMKYLNVEFKEPTISNFSPQTQQQPSQAPTIQNTYPNTSMSPIQPYSPPTPTYNSTANPAETDNLTREQRKNMIYSIYQKILGREPTQNDLNYFLNISITEPKLIQRMIDSQEHLDMVNASLEAKSLKQTTSTSQIELTRTKAELEDNKVILEKLKILLQQKNLYLSKMRSQLTKVSKMRGNFRPSNSGSTQYKGSLAERFFNFFSGILG